MKDKFYESQQARAQALEMHSMMAFGFDGKQCYAEIDGKCVPYEFMGGVSSVGFKDLRYLGEGRFIGRGKPGMSDAEVRKAFPGRWSS